MDKQDRIKQLLEIKNLIDGDGFSYREAENDEKLERLVHKKSYNLINKKTRFAHTFNFIVTNAVLEKDMYVIYFDYYNRKTNYRERVSIANSADMNSFKAIENLLKHEVGSSDFCKIFSRLVALYIERVDSQ